MISVQSRSSIKIFNACASPKWDWPWTALDCQQDLIALTRLALLRFTPGSDVLETGRPTDLDCPHSFNVFVGEKAVAVILCELLKPSLSPPATCTLKEMDSLTILKQNWIYIHELLDGSYSIDIKKETTKALSQHCSCWWPGSVRC